MSASKTIVSIAAATCATLTGFGATPAHAMPAIPAQPRVAQSAPLPMSAPLNKTTVSGKYCSKYKNGWKVKIPRSKKNGTELCRFSFKTDYLNVAVNSTFKVYKANNYRLKTAYKLTTYKENVAGSWAFYAAAESVKQTGYSHYYFDEVPPSTKTYTLVKGVAFTAAGEYAFCQVYNYPDGPKLDGCWRKSWKARISAMKSG